MECKKRMMFPNISFFYIENVLNYLKFDLFYQALFLFFGTNYKVYVFVGATLESPNVGINLPKLVDT